MRFNVTGDLSANVTVCMTWTEIRVWFTVRHRTYAIQRATPQPNIQHQWRIQEYDDVYAHFRYNE